MKILDATSLFTFFCPAQERALDLLIYPKECGASHSEINHSHTRTSIESRDAIFMQHLSEYLVGGRSLMLHTVSHELGLQHIEGGDCEASEGPRDGPIQRIDHGWKLYSALALLSAVGDQLDLTHLKYLVEGKLDGAEGDLSHDEGEVARVQTLDALVLDDIERAFHHTVVVAHLEVLLHDLEGISDKSLSHFRERGCHHVLYTYVDPISG